MSAIQPSIDANPHPLSDWLGEAIALVQRVNARLRRESTTPVTALRQGRRVLTDARCLTLAGLSDDPEG